MIGRTPLATTTTATIVNDKTEGQELSDLILLPLLKIVDMLEINLYVQNVLFITLDPVLSNVKSATR